VEKAAMMSEPSALTIVLNMTDEDAYLALVLAETRYSMHTDAGDDKFPPSMTMGERVDRRIHNQAVHIHQASADRGMPALEVAAEFERCAIKDEEMDPKSKVALLLLLKAWRHRRKGGLP
jgi:hypothetical protein